VAVAVAFDSYGGPEVLRAIDVVDEQPGPGQVRVRVRSAGVNPVDCKFRRGYFEGKLDVKFPARLGNEFAGTVDQTGPDVTGIIVGTDVLGFSAGVAYAQYVVVGADQVTAKPAGLAFDVAGGLSAVGQTAYNALRELGVHEGDTLLIHAAAGGVGTIATQLARRLGATVIGTASERNHDYLRSLGAQPVTYGAGLADRVRRLAPSGVDAVLDAIGDEEAIESSLVLAKDRDRIGTLAREDVDRFGIRRLRGTRSAAILGELANQVATGALRLPVWRTFPLVDAADAHREVETGHVRGKVVLTVD
jgi:enoyl reductase